MDLLFKRYADPFSLLDGYIRTLRFREFIHEIVKIKHEDDRWEFFLHRVWDKSFDEFCKSLNDTDVNTGMSDDEIKTTIQQSMDILGNFHPPQEEGEMNGCI